MNAQPIVIDPPLKGIWKSLRPPGHHPFALDFVQQAAQKNSFHQKSPLAFFTHRIPSANYQCWGQPVFAPVDGTVIRTGTGWEDHKYTNLWKTIAIWYNATFRFEPEEKNGRLDIRPNAGNHVMIQSKEGYIVFLAHLQNHSVTVSENDRVRRGQAVGSVGNSGNSTMPHLHINLFDQMEDPYQAQVLPFVFTRYESQNGRGNWVKNESTLPRAGTVVRFHRP